MNFSDSLRAASRERRTRIVLALDLEGPGPEPLLGRSIEVLRQASEYVCAVKINRQLVLSLGLRKGVDAIVKLAHELSLPTIMDGKLNDVGHTNEFMMRSYMEAGFDGIIVSPVPGWEGGLDAVFKLAAENGKAVIVLVYMSNPGAESFHSLMVARERGNPRPMFEYMAEMAVEWKAGGAIVGATRPEIIARVREIVGDRLAIFSPGVGAQGGDPKAALRAGADYLIVGRSIYGAMDPAKAAMGLRDALL